GRGIIVNIKRITKSEVNTILLASTLTTLLEKIMRAPDKVQSLMVLKSRNTPIETIIDVGVKTFTPELIAVYPDKHHLLFELVKEHRAIGKSERFKEREKLERDEVRDDRTTEKGRTARPPRLTASCSAIHSA